MRKLLILLNFLLFVNMFAIGQNDNKGEQQTQAAVTIESLQSQVDDLQKINADLQKQIQEISQCNSENKEEIKRNYEIIHSDIGNAIALISLIITIISIVFGVVSPLNINSQHSLQTNRIVNNAVEKCNNVISQNNNKIENVQSELSNIRNTNLNSASNIITIQNEVSRNAILAQNAAQSAVSSVELADALLKKNLGENDEALKLFTKAIANNPYNAQAYYHRATLKKNMGLNEEALQDFDSAISTDNDYMMAYYGRALLKKNMGKNEDALKDYDKAIELNPNYAMAYYNRAILRKNTGDYDGALQDYNKAISLNSKHTMAYFNRALLKSAMGQKQEAIADYSQVIALNPNYAKHTITVRFYVRKLAQIWRYLIMRKPLISILTMLELIMG